MASGHSSGGVNHGQNTNVSLGSARMEAMLSCRTLCQQMYTQLECTSTAILPMEMEGWTSPGLHILACHTGTSDFIWQPGNATGPCSASFNSNGP